MTKDEIQEKCLTIVKPLHRAGAALSMGSGKTLLGLKHMILNTVDHSRFLVVAPKKSIFESWKEEAKLHKLEYLLDRITFVTYLSLNKTSLANFYVIYLDECHNLLYSHQESLSKYNGKILGLTGTKPKFVNSEKGFMVDRFCPIVFEYNTDEAIDDKILNDYKIIVHYLDLDVNKTLKMEKSGKVWYTSERASYDYWSNRIEASSGSQQLQMMRIMRMKALQMFTSKERLAKEVLYKIPYKCLIFANTQEQAARLATYTYHSKNKESEKNLDLFKKGVINVLACVEQLNEGINIPNLREGIILHLYGNERKGRQKLGRFLRLNVDQVATLHILCYRDTVDENWVRSALETLDQTKITYKN